MSVIDIDETLSADKTVCNVIMKDGREYINRHIIHAGYDGMYSFSSGHGQPVGMVLVPIADIA